MKTALKITGLVIGLILFLSITVKNKPIFNHIYSVISPMTTSAQKATEGFFSRSVTSTHSYSKKLFDNSDPRLGDAVKTKMSGLRKNVADPAEDISEREKQQLDQLIKTHY